MRIAIVGAGAMGGLFGGRLAASGQDVTLVDVAKAHLAAIAADGLLLETDDGAARIPVRPSLAADVSGLCDLMLVFTKGTHTAAAMASVMHLLGPDTRVLTVQNGLGNAELIAAAAPGVRVLMGMTSWPADLAGPGHVTSHGHGEVRIWTMDGGSDPALPAIVAAMNAAGLNCVADPAVEVAIWEKVAFNAAMNSVSAVTRLSVGPMADSPEARALVAAVLEEVLAVANARGLAVDAARVHGAVAAAFVSHRSHKASMLQDVLAGRRTEIEQINGAVVALGQALGVATPVTRVLCDLVRAIDSVLTAG